MYDKIMYDKQRVSKRKFAHSLLCFKKRRRNVEEFIVELENLQ